VSTPQVQFSKYASRPWLDEIIIREWSAGTLSGRIAEMAGVTKNAIIGRMHRMVAAGLMKDARRPSPIRRRADLYGPPPAPPAPPAPRIAQARGPTIPPLKSAAANSDSLFVVEAAPVAIVIKTPRRIVPIVPLPRAAVTAAPAPRPIPTGRVTECLYPIGEPRAPGFRMCDDPSVPGRVYCAEHFRVCHSRAKDQRIYTDHSVVRIRPPLREGNATMIIDRDFEAMTA
jgi:GcrA cell cycle regulator